MSRNNEHYFTNGHYDVQKSEQRRQQLKEGVFGGCFRRVKFTPRGISTGEYLRQRMLHGMEATHNLITVAITGI